MQKRSDQSEYAALNFTQIGDYKLGNHLGSGAYASVKQAVHRATGMLIAVKIYDKTKISELSRKKSVIREVQILKKIQHQSLPALYDVIDSPNQLYLVMEFVQGQNLNLFLQGYTESLDKRIDEIDQKKIENTANQAKLNPNETKYKCLTEYKAAQIM